jgi:hypothetical protein
MYAATHVVIQVIGLTVDRTMMVAAMNDPEFRINQSRRACGMFSRAIGDTTRSVDGG